MPQPVELHFYERKYSDLEVKEVPNVGCSDVLDKVLDFHLEENRLNCLKIKVQQCKESK